MTLHSPVMPAEAMRALITDPDGYYVDCTFGRGGHTREILNRLSDHGRLLVLDKDPDAIAFATEEFGGEPRVTIAGDSFSRIASHVGADEQLSGVLLDLGVSSPQLEDPARGFSFQHDGPLDMRMNHHEGITAREWLAGASESEIATVLRVYGEERFARAIARRIVRARAEKPLETTRELAALVEGTIPYRERNKHPATRTFQAIRLFVNSELDDLKACLEGAVSLLEPGGRMVVISFHSLEDRIVKRFFRDEERGDLAMPELPLTENQIRRRLVRVGRVTRPSTQEVAANARARSAIMRVAERTGQR